jgi:hypothetical protein
VIKTSHSKPWQNQSTLTALLLVLVSQVLVLDTICKNIAQQNLLLSLKIVLHWVEHGISSTVRGFAVSSQRFTHLIIHNIQRKVAQTKKFIHTHYAVTSKLLTS